MDRQLDGIVLTPEGEAERLWRLAEKALVRAPGSIAELCEAIGLGVRVIQIGVVRRLQPNRDRFPVAIASLLDSPPAEVDPMRDFVNPPRSIEFIDVVDLLSDAALPCISPRLHHGREEHAESCLHARAATLEIMRFSLSENERRPLMLIGAYRNRLFSLPPPVKIVPSQVMNAFPTLAVLADRLFLASRSMPV